MRLVTDDAWAVMTIWMEARGESHAGRVAIGEVIRNRMAQRYSSDGSVSGTVFHAFQFSGWNTQDRNRELAARLDDTDAMVVDCAKAWVESVSTRTVGGALLYFNPATVREPLWVEDCRRVAVIGQHHFYVPQGNSL